MHCSDTGTFSNSVIVKLFLKMLNSIREKSTLRVKREPEPRSLTLAKAISVCNMSRDRSLQAVSEVKVAK